MASYGLNTISSWPKFQQNGRNSGNNPLISSTPTYVGTISAALPGTPTVVTSPILSADGLSLYICAGSSLFALRTTNLSTKWSVATTAFSASGGTTQYSSPVLDGNGVIFFTDNNGYLYAVSDAGSTATMLTYINTGLTFGSQTCSPVVTPRYNGENATCLYYTDGANLQQVKYLSGSFTLGQTLNTFAPINLNISSDSNAYAIASNNGVGKDYLVNLQTTPFTMNIRLDPYVSFFNTNTLFGIDNHNYTIFKYDDGHTSPQVVVACNFNEGENIFSYPLVQSVNTSINAFTSLSESSDGLTIYCIIDTYLYSINSFIVGGSAQFMQTHPKALFQIPNGASVIRAPVIIQNNIYLTTSDNYIYCLQDLGTSIVISWSQSIDSNPSYMAVGSDASLYLGSANGNVYKITQNNTPCYVKGTMIQTTVGEVAVEDLTQEHVLVTRGEILDNQNDITEHGVEPVVKITNFTINTSNPLSRPVIFKKGCLGDDIPNCDLHVSPDHSLFLDGKQLIAKNAVNDTTITYDTECEIAHYYHIVTSGHHVIYANNTPAETLHPSNVFANS